MSRSTHAPTALQQHGIDWLCTRVEAGEPVSALTGYAGTGKTTVIPHLRTRLLEMGRAVTLAAPTHRAAAVLRSKGLPNVETVHSACTIPYFKAPYVACMQWLGEPGVVGTNGLYALAEEFDEAGVPFLIRTQLAACKSSSTPEDLKRQALTYPADEVLRTIRIDGSDFIEEFGPRPAQGGVLILDEASMVDTAMLGMACDVFDQVILVGDPGQLPPVEGEPTLAETDHFLLTEIHRQAQESKIVQLAYAVRDGLQYWRRPLAAYAPDVQVCDHYPAREAQTCPVLVFRNGTRIACTLAIRQALGFPPDRPVVGEPLICRARSARDRLKGLYNNASFRVLTVEGDRHVIVEDQLSGHRCEADVYLEELDEARGFTPGQVPFRFGYVFTVHTAQGGEWPQVAISLPKARSHNGMCFYQGRRQEPACWGYTGITRGKERLIFLTNHHFV